MAWREEAYVPANQLESRVEANIHSPGYSDPRLLGFVDKPAQGVRCKAREVDADARVGR